MTYEEMMSIGKSCGLTTIGECYDNVECHYDTFFKVENVNEELYNLQKDICKKNPEGFMEAFSVSQDLINKWNESLGKKYNLSYIPTDCLKDNGDVKAIACINAYPVDVYGEQMANGYVIVQIILSEHNDIIVVFNRPEEKINSNVLELINQAKTEMKRMI